MAGHSHWKTVKRTKDSEDRKKGKIFSKIAQEIIVAVKEKGKDIQVNPRLRAIIEKAKEYNLPKDNIERAIRKGAGELPGGNLEEFFFEAYGPYGIAIIIESITDNKNRTLAEIKQVLNQNNGKIVNEGGIKWMFERKEMDGHLEWVSKYEIELSEEDKKIMEKLFEKLSEVEGIQEIYSNLKN